MFQAYGLEVLIFDTRINYHRNLERTPKANHFGSAYFCRGILPSPLVFETLQKYDKALL